MSHTSHDIETAYEVKTTADDISPVSPKPRYRTRSLPFVDTSSARFRRRLSRLSNCEIFTINENAATVSTNNVEEAEEVVRSSTKRRVKRSNSKIVDISNFPLLVTTADELISLSSKPRYKPGPGHSRAKSAPLRKTHSLIEAKTTSVERDQLDLGSSEGTSATSPTSSNACLRTVRNHFDLVADSANFREQKQLERQLKGIQNLERMNISNINKEKQVIIEKSKTLPSMIYPDVFTGKKPRYIRKGGDQGDSIDSVSYLCDRDVIAADTKQVKRSAAWNNAVDLVMRNCVEKSPVAGYKRV